MSVNPKDKGVDLSRTDRVACLGCITTSSLFLGIGYATYVGEGWGYEVLFMPEQLIVLVICLLPAIALTFGWWNGRRIRARSAKESRPPPDEPTIGKP